MKKHTIRTFACGFFSALLILAFIVPVVATNSTQQIMATYNGVVIYVNGLKLNPKDANGNPVKPFVVDGTTYLPLRAVADAVGYDVEYNASVPSITLTSSTDITASPPPSTKPTTNTLDTTFQSSLTTRVNKCLNVANVAYNNLQSQYNDYLSRGMARSSNAQTIAAAQESVKSDILVMKGMIVCIGNATTNDELNKIESDFAYYESMY